MQLLDLYRGALTVVSGGRLRDGTLAILYVAAITGLGTMVQLIMWPKTNYTA